MKLTINPATLMEVHELVQSSFGKQEALSVSAAPSVSATPAPSAK